MELWWSFDCNVLKICNFIWFARKSTVYENLEFCLGCYKILIFYLVVCFEITTLGGVVVEFNCNVLKICKI